MDKDPLQLRRLPARRAPQGLWPAIEARLDSSGRERRWPPLALAAAVAGAAVLVAILARTGPEPASAPADATADLLASARQASLRLEREVSGARSNVLGAGDAAELAWIESELRLTDELLAERPGDVSLWLERTELLGEMARLYDRNDWQTQLRLASY